MLIFLILVTIKYGHWQIKRLVMKGYGKVALTINVLFCTTLNALLIAINFEYAIGIQPVEGGAFSAPSLLCMSYSSLSTLLLLGVLSSFYFRKEHEKKEAISHKK